MEPIQDHISDGLTYTLTLTGIPKPLVLPIIPLSSKLAISLLMTIDLSLSLSDPIYISLATQLSHLNPDIIVGPATLGIPVVIEVTRALLLDRYVILQKSPKVHLADALSVTVKSITSQGEQNLLLDKAAVPLLKGRRVVVVDDVVASGGSLKGALELVRKAGGNVVGAGVILTEGWEWKEILGEDDANLVVALGHIPQFERGDDGEWKATEGT